MTLEMQYPEFDAATRLLSGMISQGGHRSLAQRGGDLEHCLVAGTKSKFSNSMARGLAPGSRVVAALLTCSARIGEPLIVFCRLSSMS